MLPFCKTSKSRKGTRRAHHALKAINVGRCPKCGRARLPHRMCANCGYVNKGLQVELNEEETA